MSVLLADHPNSAPYRFANLDGETFTYIDQTAQEAVENWSDEDDEND